MRKKDENWGNGTVGHSSWDEAHMSVAMDLRDELKEIKQLLQRLVNVAECPNATAIPKILRGIRANTAKKRRAKVMTMHFEAVRQGDSWDDPYKTTAWDAEGAAENVCEAQYSEWEYPDGPIVLEVRDDHGFTQTIEVCVEAVPSFRAHEVEYGPKHCLHPHRNRDTTNGTCYGCGGQFEPVTKEEQDTDQKAFWAAYRAKHGKS